MRAPELTTLKSPQRAYPDKTPVHYHSVQTMSWIDSYLHPHGQLQGLRRFQVCPGPAIGEVQDDRQTL